MLATTMAVITEEFNTSDISVFHGNKTSRKVPETPFYILLSITILYTLVFIIGVFGNSLVAIVIRFSRNMRSSVNMYLVNLCFADIMVLLVCLPPVLVELHTKEVWYFGEVLCKAVPFLESVVASASVFTIIAISIERFKVVCKPLSITKESPAFTGKILIVIWITAVALSSPLLAIVVFKSSHLTDGTPVHVCRMYANSYWKKGYLLSNAITTYLIPMLIIVILYGFLGRKLVRKSKSHLILYDRNVEDKLKLRRQVIHTIVTVVCVFFIGHLPYRIVCIWWMFEDKHKIAEIGLEKNLVMIYFSRFFIYLNHALNPILYNFVSTKFRMSLYVLRKECYCLSKSREDQANGVIGPKRNNVLCSNSKDELKLISINKKSNSSPSLSDRHDEKDFSLVYGKRNRRNSYQDSMFDSHEVDENQPTYYTHDKNVDDSYNRTTTVRIEFDANGKILAIKLKSK